MPDDDFPAELTEEASDDKPEKLHESLYSRIMEMPVSEQIKLATVGNKEARSILIKDSNRLVIQAIINSPKVSEQEIIGFASNRNLPKEVPMLIANKKEFLKNYNIKLALVSNAKTPVPTALRLLSFIYERDLRHLAKSKNVSSVISRTAMKLLSQKGRV